MTHIAKAGTHVKKEEFYYLRAVLEHVSVKEAVTGRSISTLNLIKRCKTYKTYKKQLTKYRQNKIRKISELPEIKEEGESALFFANSYTMKNVNQDKIHASARRIAQMPLRDTIETRFWLYWGISPEGTPKYSAGVKALEFIKMEMNRNETPKDNKNVLTLEEITERLEKRLVSVVESSLKSLKEYEKKNPTMMNRIKNLFTKGGGNNNE